MAMFHKTPQRESGPFKKTQNLLTVDIDNQGTTDFSASYLDMEIMFKDATPAYYTGQIKLGNPLTGASYSGAAMLKNVRLESDEVGLVEEVRFSNRHSQTMRKFLMTEQENVSSTIRGENVVKLDPLTNRGHVHIPLSDVLGCGDSVWPNQTMGMSRLKMELEDVVPWAYNETPNGVLISAGAQKFADVAIATLPTAEIITVNKFTSLAQAQYYFQSGLNYTLRQTGAAGPPTGSVVRISSVVCAGTIALPAVATVTLSTVLTAAAPPANVTNISLEITTAEGGGFDCVDIAEGAAGAPVSVVSAVGGVAADGANPWLVGYYYNVGFTDGAAPNILCHVSSVRLLTKAANLVTAANLDLTFDRPFYNFPAAAVTELTEVFVSEPAMTAVDDFEVYSCNLITAKLVVQPAPAPFVFKTYVLEMVNMQPTTDFRRQVMIDSSCDQVKLLMPLNSSLLSTRDTLTSYRNSIQSVDTTTQDITIDNNTNGSLYYDRLFGQLDGVKSLQPMNGTEEVVIIAEKIPEAQAGLNNVVEFRLSASAPMADKNAYFYKRVTKQF